MGFFLIIYSYEPSLWLFLFFFACSYFALYIKELEYSYIIRGYRSLKLHKPGSGNNFFLLLVLSLSQSPFIAFGMICTTFPSLFISGGNCMQSYVYWGPTTVIIDQIIFYERWLKLKLKLKVKLRNSTPQKIKKKIMCSYADGQMFSVIIVLKTKKVTLETVSDDSLKYYDSLGMIVINIYKSEENVRVRVCVRWE